MDFGHPLGDVIPSVDGRVLLVLARSGLPMTGKRVAEAAMASTERVRQVLARMSDAGLVESRRAGQATLHEANRNHVLWPAIERLALDADQVVHLMKARIVEMLARVADAETLARVTVALFGSVARGDARPTSDVDVLLVTPDDVGPDRTEVFVATIIEAVTTATGNECNVYAATRSRIDELIQTNDPMVPSWDRDAVVFHGPDLRHRLRGAPWDGR